MGKVRSATLLSSYESLIIFTVCFGFTMANINSCVYKYLSEPLGIAISKKPLTVDNLPVISLDVVEPQEQQFWYGNDDNKTSFFNINFWEKYNNLKTRYGLNISNKNIQLKKHNLKTLLLSD